MYACYWLWYYVCMILIVLDFDVCGMICACMFTWCLVLRYYLSIYLKKKKKKMLGPKMDPMHLVANEQQSAPICMNFAHHSSSSISHVYYWFVLALAHSQLRIFLALRTSCYSIAAARKNTTRGTKKRSSSAWSTYTEQQYSTHMTYRRVGKQFERYYFITWSMITCIIWYVCAVFVFVHIYQV